MLITVEKAIDLALLAHALDLVNGDRLEGNCVVEKRHNRAKLVACDV